MKIFKKILIIMFTLILTLIITTIIALVMLNRKTKSILDDYFSVYTNEKYQEKVKIENITYIKQDISCGYATIEMLSKWLNGDITEKSLYDEYGKVVTSTGKSFEEEMNKQFTDYKTTMYKYLKNTELIDKVYESLSNGIPVPIEWAAKLEDTWTLHYSIIIGIDIPNDKITVLNPYGYKEKITVQELLDRTSFEAYENMPIFFKLGFAFNIFEKNTIFIMEQNR